MLLAAVNRIFIDNPKLLQKVNAAAGARHPTWIARCRHVYVLFFGLFVDHFQRSCAFTSCRTQGLHFVGASTTLTVPELQAFAGSLVQSVPDTTSDLSNPISMSYDALISDVKSVASAASTAAQPCLDADIAQHLLHNYGDRAPAVLAYAQKMALQKQPAPGGNPAVLNCNAMFERFVCVV